MSPSLDMNATGARCRLELYVAGDTLNSRRAAQNLKRLMEDLIEPVTVTTVDVLKEPKLAFEQGIFVTPSLIARDGERMSLVIGDLSDQELVVRSLEPLGLIANRRP
ncbi:KaiB domain-containing protein [Kaistia soli DSM 19436]|uniref:KaiB domain-containing protein n=1 Tax=Kaistia soli DSM 19436 TaxID=1122133 RepID=A0A1M5H763_9HYPH|nr:KaiB domain-containing protein [Kaistia soli DSM 19436]